MPDINTSVFAAAARIVAAHIRTNQVAPGDLPSLIREVYRSLVAVGQGAEAAPEPPTPFVPVKKSVFADHIVCLEDGKKLKMLTRYLKARYGMTPADYRAKWDLPPDYPLVAPSYRQRRSDIAKLHGLGQKPAAGVDAAEPVAAGRPEVTILPARRARGVKA